MYFTGYHGTSQEFASKIVADGCFTLSSGNKEWLGSGIYFYEMFSDSLDWADKKYPRDHAVLHAVVSVEEDEYIDLDSIEGESIYRRIINIIADTTKEIGNFHKGDAQNNQCAVARYIWTRFNDIKLLLASFPNEASAFPLIKDYRTKRRELCVKNNSAIKGIQLIELKIEE